MGKKKRNTSIAYINRKKSLISLASIIAVAVIGTCIFLLFYNRYIDKILYAERLSQMKEVTTQLYSGLEDVVRSDWGDAHTQRRFMEDAAPETLDTMLSYMNKQVLLSGMDNNQIDIVAVDENGSYYTRTGRKGVLPEQRYLVDEPQEISFVSNSMISNNSSMVMLTRFSKPLNVTDGDKNISIVYYGIAQNMEALKPYFSCDAYNGTNGMYVMDEQGLKLFSSGKYDYVKAYNIYSALEGLEYRHNMGFTSAKNELEQTGVAYSNAVSNGEEYYYSLYQMENARWILLFTVPSKYVATNTVKLINTTIRMVLVFAVILVFICATVVFVVMSSFQRAALDVERRNNDELEKINGRLEAAVRTAEQAESKANEANNAKSDFLANMSHDIRTPMNAIMGITNLMEYDLDDKEKLKDYIHKVQSSSKHLLGLINDILDMSKIESSEISLNMESIYLAEQVGQIESIMRPQAEERGHRFTVRVHRIVHEYLKGDAVRLRQIFINLLSNAVKYTPDGGDISLDITEVKSDSPGRALFNIKVKDNGYGMTKEFIEHIFEPFVRAEGSVTNKIQGTGLGMAITKRIVDLMGGTISVDSEPGKGSTFEVNIPFIIDNIVPEIDADNILLISDDDSLTENVIAAFSNTDISVSVVETIEKARPVIETKKPDIIFLSGNLHNSELSRIVTDLKQSEDSPVLLFCVDYQEYETACELLKNSHVDGIIVRPFFVSDVAAKVKNAKNKAKAKEEREGLKGFRFLCAEDNELNAEILKAVLAMDGAECVIYPDGKQLVEAFENVSAGEYDAILMDVQMPVMNGLDATKAIRKSKNPLGRTFPIIAMTANAFSSDVQACLNAGMDAHVAKPIDVDVLERTLKAVVEV